MLKNSPKTIPMMKIKKTERGAGIPPSLYTLLLLAFIGAGFALLGGCKEKKPEACQGYYEGDYVYIAAPGGGRLLQLLADKGTNVAQGSVLFVLDPEPETMLRRQNEALRDQARAQWSDSLKGLRPHELDALQAALAQREALGEMSGLNAQRLYDVRKERMVSENDYDQARYAHEADVQAVAQARANLEQARQGAREDQIQALADQITAQEAALGVAQWNLSQKTQTAKQSGMIYDTYYRPGEWVPAGKPVLSLLPPENIKVLFFVQEERLGTVHIGQPVYIRDSLHEGLCEARITYISPSPEYTPPVIFSRDTSAKLIFRMEARPVLADVQTMPPGQPVDVYLEKP